LGQPADLIPQNLVDQDEYPAAQEIHERCIVCSLPQLPSRPVLGLTTLQSMISHLWHAPKSATALGTATIGSSEAIMLGGLALKRRWQEKMKAAGRDIHNPGPNIVMGAEAQVALEKFARYFDVDCRLVPVTKGVGDGLSVSDSTTSPSPTIAMGRGDAHLVPVFSTFGMSNTFGVFQSYYQFSGYPNQTASTISCVGSVQLFLLFFIGSVAGRLYDKGHFRSLIYVGTVINVVW
jgi:glutamate decarboxylase